MPPVLEQTGADLAHQQCAANDGIRFTQQWGKRFCRGSIDVYSPPPRYSIIPFSCIVARESFASVRSIEIDTSRAPKGSDFLIYRIDKLDLSLYGLSLPWRFCLRKLLCCVTARLWKRTERPLSRDIEPYKLMIQVSISRRKKLQNLRNLEESEILIQMFKLNFSERW